MRGEAADASEVSYNSINTQGADSDTRLWVSLNFCLPAGLLCKKGYI